MIGNRVEGRIVIIWCTSGVAGKEKIIIKRKDNK